MKLKAAIRYQAVELVQSAAVFCLIIGAIIAAVALIGLTKGAYLSVPNMGFLPYFLMPLLALSTFQGDIRFLMQMGLTRLRSSRARLRRWGRPACSSVSSKPRA